MHDSSGPDLRGAQGARAPGPPPTRGPPPSPSYFIFGSIDTHNSCVYTTYASLTKRINFFHILMQAACTTISYAYGWAPGPPPAKSGPVTRTENTLV